jgi:phage virion morphogenesis protein
MIEINLLSGEAEKALRDLASRVQNLRPALKAIGERMVESTKQRFVTSTAPDGTQWEPNKPSTIAKYTHRVSGTMTKDRKLMTKKGEQRWDSKKPLIDSGTLGEQIHARLIDNKTLFVYSSMEYAAMQQFGGTKAEFPQLWGDIPPRPFLGVSAEDNAMIEKLCREYLQP